MVMKHGYRKKFIPAWTNKQFVNALASRYKTKKTKFALMQRKQLIAIFLNSERK